MSAYMQQKISHSISYEDNFYRCVHEPISALLTEIQTCYYTKVIVYILTCLGQINQCVIPQ